MPELDESSWGRERLLESLDAFRRGLSDAPLLRKWSEGQACAVDKSPEEPMTFEISNGEVDRHGDVIVPEGWQLESYQRNPVFLWAPDDGKQKGDRPRGVCPTRKCWPVSLALWLLTC